MDDHIWFTRKARIFASERLLSNNKHSQYILIYYSLLNVIISIYSTKYELILGESTSLHLIIMATSILVLSLIVSNMDYKRKALEFKDNYINLQLLLEDKSIHISLKWKKYCELLKQTDNHAHIDDLMFRVLNRHTLTSRKPMKREIAHVYLYRLAKQIILALIYLWPLFAIFTL
ncbi:hypothetical protein A7985_05565 [Pseudoalteromonas luteoviolacea]|uniref:SMODS and SLOG-associating 2TM effector domain-containing protein n=1 Tax=Pseudoalteromonas luteoviolacea TaxID=43657 RepID=A0A1C0TXM1_9GAMM|nr:hypothetical protein A7985_05565 [Pseudoalteromonas luteoviolacea]